MKKFFAILSQMWKAMAKLRIKNIHSEIDLFNEFFSS